MSVNKSAAHAELDDRTGPQGRRRTPDEQSSARVTGLVGLSSSSLSALGLSPLEERVYRQVVGSTGSTAFAIARRLRAGVPEIEGILGQLVRSGLVTAARADVPAYVRGRGVEPSGSSEVRYVPEPPANRLSRLLQLQAARLVNAGNAVEQLTQLYGAMQEDWAAPDSVRVVHGADEVNRTVFELLSLTSTELVQLDREPFVRAGRPCLLPQAMFDALDRDVAIRTIYAEDAFRVEGYADYMAEAARSGEQARTMKHLPLRMLVSDARTAMLPLAADGPWVSAALVVRGRELVEGLGRLFDELWEHASPRTAEVTAEEVPREASTGADYTEQDVALLRMLAADLTEDAIGRHLGTSSRTIGRRLAVLQRRMGVHTRFTMGAEASRLGLL